MQSNMEHITAVAETEYKSEFEPTKYTPYLGLIGELWDVHVHVFCKDFEENKYVMAPHCTRTYT